MKVLSLFDGMAGARQALKNLGIKCKYYASEIDPVAIQIAKNNHPDIIHIGDVRSVTDRFGKIDLLIGGSPCQDLSQLNNKGKGLRGKRSGLFFEYLRIYKELKPKLFIFENVRMGYENQEYITSCFGYEPTKIDSAVLSAQARGRIYWSNIDILEPYTKSKKVIKDILEKRKLPINGLCEFRQHKIEGYTIWCGTTDHKSHIQRRVYDPKGKSPVVHTRFGSRPKIHLGAGTWRRLTIIELERLQGYPDNYTAGFYDTDRMRPLGNAFSVPTIEHILKHRFTLKQPKQITDFKQLCMW